jgi:hypothetical protein
MAGKTTRHIEKSKYGKPKNVLADMPVMKIRHPHRRRPTMLPLLAVVGFWISYSL